MLAGTSFDDEIISKNINSINNNPKSGTSTQPTFNFNVKYTFAEAKAEVYIGTLLEDVLTFDSTAILGIRKDFTNVGILSAGLLSSVMPTRTWSDPYATNGYRQVKDMSSKGMFLKWEGVMESNFNVELRSRKFKIDGGDKSGLGSPYIGELTNYLNPYQLNNTLNREGDLLQLITAYRFNLDQKNLFKVALRLSDYDLDGSAMKYKRVGLKLDYAYIGRKWDFITVLGLYKDLYDNNNPLYNKKADANNLGLAFTALYKNPFDISKDLSLTTSIGFYDSNSDIDFYDSRITMLNLGILYKF